MRAMAGWWLVGCVGWGVGVVAVVGAGAQVPASERLQAVVQSIDVPAGERVALKAEGRGVQVYRCEVKAAAAWVFVEPEAQLFVKGAAMGTHGAGPSWHWRDGSAVWGEVVAKAPAASADAIPSLLLKVVKSEGSGALTGVNFVQRVETKGGAAPSGGCDAARAGAIVKMPYSAAYVFYRATD